MKLINICLIWSIILFSFSLVSFVSSLFILLNKSIYFLEFELLSLNSFKISMVVLLDYISLVFMSLVFLISSMVVYYSKSYMMGDKNLNRFIMLILMFILSMMLLILSPNMISILLGWDGLGLVSYCLVIYYQNEKSYNAGMLTVLSNRVGDVFILICIVWMFIFGSWNFIFYLNFFKFDDNYMFIGMLVMVAAITKSAQIPFSSWLPAAMAAPTPVSSLVHSSTLVTAGVYLMIRFSELLINSLAFKILFLLGGLTMFMSGMAANYEFDLKKIIALSTLSQLGLMMSILSLGESFMTFFHLLTHAMFKALLFMCAGVMIHKMKNFQDIRYMGGIVKFMPLTGSCFIVSNMALCGFPFLAGFYSKDLILDSVSMMDVNIFMWLLFFFSTGLTVSYTIRVNYYSMIIPQLSIYMKNFEDSDNCMFKSMLLLMMLSVMGGSMLSWVMCWEMKMIYLNLFLKMMVTLVILLGMIGGVVVIVCSKFIFFFEKYYYLSFFNCLMWFMIFLSTWGINYYPLVFSNKILRVLDYGWGESLINSMSYKILINFFKLDFLFHQVFLKMNFLIFISVGLILIIISLSI